MGHRKLRKTVGVAVGGGRLLGARCAQGEPRSDGHNVCRSGTGAEAKRSNGTSPTSTASYAVKTGIATDQHERGGRWAVGGSGGGPELTQVCPSDLSQLWLQIAPPRRRTPAPRWAPPR